MFHECKNKEDVKSLFRKLCYFLHPDHGGDTELMILLNDSYEMALDFYDTHEEAPSQFRYEKVFEDVLNGMSQLEIIQEILAYASKHKRFNTDYVSSLQEFLEEKGYLTSSQYNSLVKIYYSFRMDKEKAENEPKD